jgi:DNA-binding LacI/PurR family transcriptional regulator
LWAVPEVGDNQMWFKQRSTSLPVPIMFLTDPPHSDLASIDYDNYLGGKLATGHLLQQGCRRIAHLSGPQEWLSARQRKRGWQDALAEAGIDAGEMPCVEGNWSSSSGEQAFERLLAASPDIDAVFVANDQMAVSVLQIACKRGIRIPQDLAVVGFDGLAESEFYWPPLTTVYQDLHKLGSMAVEEMIDAIEALYSEEEGRQAKTMTLQPQLIIRESSKK